MRHGRCTGLPCPAVPRGNAGTAGRKGQYGPADGYGEERQDDREKEHGQNR